MEIPKYYKFFDVVLEVLTNTMELIHRNDVVEQAVDLMMKKQGLLQEVLNVLNSTVDQPVIKVNAGWALSYLNMAGYVSNEKKRGYYEITPLGLENFPCDQKKVKEIVREIGKNKKIGKSQHLNAGIEKSEEENEEMHLTDDGQNEKSWKDEILQTLKSLTPTGFEEFCGHFLKHMEFSNVSITQRSRDGGFDASAILKTGLIATSVLIECKRYEGNVDVKVVRQLRGVMAENQVTKGIIFTTGGYTKDAYNSVLDRDDITLLCGDDICNLMKKHKFGVETKTVEETIVKYHFLENFNNFKLICKN